MRRIGRKGIATIAAVVAIVAVAGVATGTPIAVDQIDTNPNNPLYSLERVGEQIKEATYAGGVSWNLQRAKERTREYRAVARTEIPNDHLSLLEDAENRLSKAAKGIDSGRKLRKVKKTLKFHKQVLKEVRNETPGVANPAISLAISNADRLKTVLDNIELSEIRKERGIPNRVTRKLEQVRQDTRKMKGLVTQAEKGEVSGERAVRRIELRTAQTLTNKLAKAVEKEELEKHTDLVDDVQAHLNVVAKVSGDNQRLRKAIEAVKKHTKVLENVKKGVPGPAKEAIQRAVEQSKTGLRKLRKITQGKGPRISPPENAPGKPEILENIPKENREKVKALKKQAKKAIAKFQEKMGKLKSKREKIENWYESRKEKLTKKFEESRENWKENIEKAGKGFEKRVEKILEHIQERKKFRKLENFAPELENFAPGIPENFWPPFENLYWIQENKWKGQWPQGKREEGEGAGPPERVLEKVENILEKKHERLEQRLENKFDERFNKLSEKLDRTLQKLIKKREKRIRKIEEKKQKARERLENTLARVAEKLKRILPEEAVADDVLRSILKNEGLPPSLLGPKPKGEPIPFIHRGGKPPWAGPPEFVPENEEKTENEGGAYKLMGPKLPDHPVSYSINPANAEGISESTVVTELSVAFETWDNHTDKELFSDEVSTTSKRGFEQDGTNTVSFAPLDVDTAAAKTRVWYSGDTITEFDVVFNTKREFGVDPDGEGPRAIDEFDLQAVATHEAGHTLGLMDLEDSDYSEMTMYYSTDPGSTIKISLERGDIAGLHELYGE